MKHEARVISFTVSGRDTERPAIIVEEENGHVSLKLLTGRSGVADITRHELDALLNIVAEAHAYLNDPLEPKLAADDVQ